MRFFVACMLGLTLLTGCDAPLELHPKATPTATATPTADPETWSMSPDAFGPITATTTRAQALATGVYKAAPAPCADERLDWRDQKYDETGTMVKPLRPSITFDSDGKVEFIDPASGTVTDQGIRKADSFDRLLAVYDDDLIAAPDQLPDGGTFAVNGDRSHLVYVVMHGKVAGFFLAAGRVDDPDDLTPVAGTLQKSDNVRLGRGSRC